MSESPARLLQMQAPLDELRHTLKKRMDRARTLGEPGQAAVLEDALVLAEKLHGEVQCQGGAR